MDFKFVNNLFYELNIKINCLFNNYQYYIILYKMGICSSTSLIKACSNKMKNVAIKILDNISNVVDDGHTNKLQSSNDQFI